MDFLFNSKREYKVFAPLDTVRQNITSVITRHWIDFSENLNGNFINDTEFIITPKWSLAIIRWLERDLTYLKGRLEAVSNQTTITITIRPNSIFVIMFYLFIILSVLEPLNGVFINEINATLKLLFFPLFAVIILSVILFSTYRMRRRFERLLNLTPLE